MSVLTWRTYECCCDAWGPAPDSSNTDYQVPTIQTGCPGCREALQSYVDRQATRQDIHKHFTDTDALASAAQGLRVNYEVEQQCRYCARGLQCTVRPRIRMHETMIAAEQILVGMPQRIGHSAIRALSHTNWALSHTGSCWRHVGVSSRHGPRCCGKRKGDRTMAWAAAAAAAGEGSCGGAISYWKRSLTTFLPSTLDTAEVTLAALHKCISVPGTLRAYALRAVRTRGGSDGGWPPLLPCKGRNCAWKTTGTMCL